MKNRPKYIVTAQLTTKKQTDYRYSIVAAWPCTPTIMHQGIAMYPRLDFPWWLQKQNFTIEFIIAHYK